MEALQILVVEDEMIVAADIADVLERKGYQVSGIFPKGEKAFESIANDPPDLVLLDIQLRGNWDGIQTAEKIQETYQIPIIFLTANADPTTFQRAKATHPQAFLVKPFDPGDLERAIELAIDKWSGPLPEAAVSSPATAEEEVPPSPHFLQDRIFVKVKDLMRKIPLADILYAEAEGNYCRLVTPKASYLLSITLKTLGERLSHAPDFIRVHRSYLVNLQQVEEVGSVYLRLGPHQIPVSKSYREALMARIQVM